MAQSELTATSELRLCVCTWNVCQAVPPDDFNLLFGLNGTPLPDVIVMGLQEMDASPTSYLSETLADNPWTIALTKTLGNQDYVRLESIRLLGIMLLVFTKRHHVSFITNIEAQYTRTGMGGYWGNKGGVSIRLDMYGVNVCFVNCHLAAHDHAVAQRIMDYDAIVELQRFQAHKGDPITILDHDYVFWLGDLNFRIADVSRDYVIETIKQGDYSALWKHDELGKLMSEDIILVDFEEGKLDFPCTYKYDQGTDDYDSSKKQRKPGWCDRILWLTHEDSFFGVNMSVKQHSYTSLQEYKNSDHKPVVSHFSIKTLPSFMYEPAVLFETSNWDDSADGIVNYTVSPDMQISSWDWIGLYKADYKHLYEYDMFVWVSTDCLETTKEGRRRFRAVVGRISLLSFLGTYCLMYHSAKTKSILSVSQTFSITRS